MVPEGWETVRISDIAKVKGGKRMPKGRPFAEGKTPYPYIRVSDFDNGTVNTESLKCVLPDDREKIKSYTISHKDLYISIAGTIGLVGTVPMELDGAQLTENAAKICFKSKTNFERDYIKYVLSSTIGKSQIDNAKGVGGGVPKLAIFRIENIDVPLPPLLEQKTITAILSSVDDAIQATQAVIDQTRKVKQGLLQQLLTRGIGHTRFKQTEIGAIPEEWDVKPLETLSKSINNGFVGTAAKHYVNDGIPYLMAKNIRDNRIELGQLSYISNGFHKDNPRSFLETGDLLTVQSGHIGTTATVPLELSGANCHALIITKLNNEQINSDFIAYYFNSPSGRNRLSRIFVGTTIKHINTKDLRKFLVPLPSRAEQTKIANIFKEIDKNQDESKSFLIQLNQTKKGLMQDLLTGRVRVKPDEVNTT